MEEEKKPNPDKASTSRTKKRKSEDMAPTEEQEEQEEEDKRKTKQAKAEQESSKNEEDKKKQGKSRLSETKDDKGKGKMAVEEGTDFSKDYVFSRSALKHKDAKYDCMNNEFLSEVFHRVLDKIKSSSGAIKYRYYQIADKESIKAKLVPMNPMDKEKKKAMTQSLDLNVDYLTEVYESMTVNHSSSSDVIDGDGDDDERKDKDDEVGNVKDHVDHHDEKKDGHDDNDKENEKEEEKKVV